MATDDIDWVARLFAAIDARDVDRFVAFLHPEVEFQFGNAAPIRGIESTRAAVAAFFASVADLQHRVDDVWQIDAQHTCICRGEVRYRRLDDSELQVPFANVLRLRDGSIYEYSIYVDASKLHG